VKRFSAVTALIFFSCGLALQAQIQIGPEYNFRGLVFNGDSKLLSGYAMQLGDGAPDQDGSVFYHLPVDIRAFTTDFSFDQGGLATGFTFTIQNTGTNALGGGGDGLGYAGIAHSVALKFDIYGDDGAGPQTTGVYTGGNSPKVPAVAVNPASASLDTTGILAHVTYDGATLTLTLNDSASFSFPVDIPAAVGGDTAYVGFTASGAGGGGQLVHAWSFVPSYSAPNFPAGFDAKSVTLNGAAALDGANLVLTNSGQYQAGSAFFNTPVGVENERGSIFSFQIPDSGGNGFTYTFQNTGPDALGGDGAGLGYVGIHHSLALKFGLYDHDGGGSNSVGVYTAGNLPDTPDIDLTSSGVDLHSGHIFKATVIYQTSTLYLVLIDTVTNKFFVHTFTLAAPLPDIVFGDTAYVGFTAGTGAATSNPTILTWADCGNSCPTP